MSVFGIVVAAGSGERFGRPKAEVELDGRPLWLWGRTTLEAGGCSEVVVVGDVADGVPGGPRRRDSVAAGLAVMPQDAEYVVVHDAARPLAAPRLVERVLDRVRAGDVDGVVPALAVRDTLKEVVEGLVVRTVDRSRLVAVQTPQAFTARALRGAHAHDDLDATDDATLIERAGGRVAVVDGEEVNIKVTFPDDLALAESLVR